MAFNKTQKEMSSLKTKRRTIVHHRSEALQCPSINDKTIAPRLHWDIQTSPKRKGIYSKTSAEANHSIISIDEILQISDQDNIGTLLRYVTSCYM